MRLNSLVFKLMVISLFKNRCFNLYAVLIASSFLLCNYFMSDKLSRGLQSFCSFSISIIFIPLCDSYPGISTLIFYVALKLVNILLMSFSILNNLYFIVSQQMVSLLRDYEASVY